MRSTASGEAVMKKSVMFEWHKRLKKGLKCLKYDRRSGYLKIHQTYENVEKAQQLVRSARWLSTWIIAEELNLDRVIAKKTFTEYLETRKISAKIILRILKWKQVWLDISSDCLSHLGVFDRVITGN